MRSALVLGWTLGAVLTLVGGCSSGAGNVNSGGGAYCGRASQLLNRCGLSTYASSPSFDCDEPTTQQLRCIFDCQLALSCQQVVGAVCDKITAPFQNCLSKCPATTFPCGDGTTYDEGDKCDGSMDCSNNADEEGCPTFDCGDGSVVVLEYKCDGYPDCSNGADEQGCPSGSVFDCGDGTTVPASSRCDGFADCTNGADEPPSCGPDPVESDCKKLGH